LTAAGHELTGKLRFGTTPDDIRVITAFHPATGQSQELTDLRTPADNDAAADFLLEQVRSVVENPDTQLVASIAGGRKTMGALLYACLTLAGRETDRLTHVLVNEPFEALRDFWFPGQPGGRVSSGSRSDQSGSSVQSGLADPATAHVELADVPFVPLRNLFVRELNRKAGTFARLVSTCRENIRERAGAEVRLQLATAGTAVDVNGTLVKLAPLEHLLLLFLARRSKHSEPAYGAYAEAVDDLNVFRLQLLKDAPKDRLADWRHTDSLRASWDEQEIRKAVSGIRSKLRRSGGNAPLLAACLPEKGRCSLSVPGALIHFK
jgi:CRISPR-associated protein (TIGR02584 family)